MLPTLMFIPIGMLIGTLAGFFGIGGGIILMPILLLSGFSPDIAVATSLLFLFGTGLSGAVTHTRLNNVDWKTAMIVGTTGAVCAQVSKTIILNISGSYNWLLNIWLIMLLCYFAWNLYNKTKNESRKALMKNRYLAAVLIGMMVGFVSGLLGIGGGFITVPLLIAWLGYETKKAIGTSLAGIVIIACGGILGYGMQLELNFFLGLCLIIGAFIGSPFGAKMTTRYQSADITQRLWLLYIFAISAIVVDLLAAFIVSALQYVSLSILIAFLAYMLFDFYKHWRLPALEKS